MATGVSNDNYRTFFQDVSYSTAILAADSTTLNAIPAKANHTVFVQAIIFNVTTDNAATLTFQDTAATPVVVHKTRASPGLGPIDESVDFGAEGIPLTAEKGLDITFSAAGLAGRVKVIAYSKRDVVAAA